MFLVASAVTLSRVSALIMCGVEYEKWRTVSVHLVSSWINKCIRLYARPVGSLLKMKMWTKIQAIKGVIIIQIWKFKWRVIIDYDGIFTTLSIKMMKC